MLNINQLELSVIAPCFNEEGNIEQFAQRVINMFAAHQIKGELILINDGSRDRSGELIDNLAARFPDVIRGIHHSQNRGLVEGWRSGLNAALASTICIIDSDLQYQPEEIQILYRDLLSSKADIVQGYRETVTHFMGWRYIMSRTLNYILNILFGMQLTDNKSGFFVTTREKAIAFLTHKRHYRYFQILIMVSAASKGYTIHETRVKFLSRQAGRSFMPSFPLKVILGCVTDLLNGIVEFRMGRYL